MAPKRQRDSPIFKMVTAKRAKRVAQKMMTGKLLRKTQAGQKYRQAQSLYPEMKYDDNAVSANISATGATTLVLTVAQGSDNTDRIGRKITAKAIHYNLQVAASTVDLANASFPENADSIRVSLVYDKQPNGVLGTYNQVYNANNSATTPFALRNMDYIDRFDVLATDLVPICATGPNIGSIARYVPCSLETRYDGTGATIADIESGSYFLAYGDINTAGVVNASIQGVCRVVYSDD